MGGLKSGIWVSASFQIFACYRGNVIVGEGNSPGGELSEGEMSHTLRTSNAWNAL